MNNDLISRSALLKAMEEERQYLHKRGLGGAEHILVHHCLPLIDNAPTVDTYTEDDVHYAIKEGHEVGYGMAKAKFGRPQGEWLEVKEEVHYDYWTVCECSLCKHSWALGELSIEEVKDDYNFCPNCGADMRKETDND